MKMRLHQQQSGVVSAVPLPCGQHKVQKPYRSHLLSTKKRDQRLNASTEGQSVHYVSVLHLNRSLPADQVFAAGFLANTSSLVNRTLMPALLGGAGTEHARLHTQFPAEAQTLMQ